MVFKRNLLCHVCFTCLGKKLACQFVTAKSIQIKIEWVMSRVMQKCSGLNSLHTKCTKDCLLEFSTYKETNGVSWERERERVGVRREWKKKIKIVHVDYRLIYVYIDDFAIYIINYIILVGDLKSFNVMYYLHLEGKYLHNTWKSKNQNLLGVIL